MVEEGRRLDRNATLRKLEEACTDASRKGYQDRPTQTRKSLNSLINLEPAIGLAPMTCALRVRRTASRMSRHLFLLSQKPHNSWDLYKQQ
jgi:hypothetical protein